MLTIEYLNKEELKPYANNAKIHTADQVEQIKRSIEEFGFNDPIAIWHDNEIIEGHGRLLAVMEMDDIDAVPVIRLDDLSDEERRAYMLVHNKLTMNTDFDFALLDEELENIEIDMSEFGFETETQNDPVEIIEDDVPEEVEARCKLGDLWQLGSHRLICGDSTDSTVIGRLMGGEIADIAFTSPPYNAGNQGYYGKDTSKYENDDDNKSKEEYTLFLDEYLRIAMNVSQYVFCNIQSLAGNKIALIDFLYNNKDIYADTIIWHKIHGQPASAHNVLNSAFEYIHVFSNKANRAIGTLDFRGTIDNVFQMQPQHRNEYSDIHSATFSVEFAVWFVSRFAKKSVLDSFGGTGTTMIACEQLNKRCYMAELDPTYCDVIIERWENFTGQNAIKL